MQTVAIFGVGLIGGSFGLALHEAGFDGEILGVSSLGTIAAASKRGVISRAASLDEAAHRADLIYLAQPVDAILQTLEQIAPMVRRDCLISDAGSTKVQIVAKASSLFPHDQFLGGHPLAGKEQRGVEAADARLFRGRPYVLTPSSPETLRSKLFRSWLARIGAEPVDMSPEEHDRTVALTSHLPQLLSTALAQTLAKQDSPHLEAVFGQGLLDMTRLALSAPELWSSILSTNQDAINTAIDMFLQSLVELRNSIGTRDLPRLFRSAAGFSAKIRKGDCPDQGIF
ncbi:MAG TPA: prephenate dehydrogenase/arogenate dehydrogenase family protein [Bryobacteraceae bacterium]|jgi:prephenate dehydrogenase